MAIYPSRIPGFVTHRNLLDDVDANHINYIQDEFTSMAQTLGPMPHVYNDIATDLGVVYPEESDGGSIDDTVWTTAAGLSKTSVKPRVHANVSQRLDYIERGQQNHCVFLRARGLEVPRSAKVTLSERPRGIKFPAPNAKNDPFRSFNGRGITLRKSGFWIFHGSVIWMPSGKKSETAGLYTSAIEVDGAWLDGITRHRQSEDDHKTSIAQTPTRVGFLPAGSRVSLRVSHDATGRQTVRQATLGAFLIREDV